MRALIVSCCFLTALTTSFAASAQCPVLFSEMERAPEALSWDAREKRITHARLIEMDATVLMEDQEHHITLVRTPVGTAGCRRSHDHQCAPLAPVGLIDISSGALMDLLMAHKQSGNAKPQQLPGSGRTWETPTKATQNSATAQFSNWAFNPEIGFPMPQTVDIEQNGKTFNIRIERFLLKPQ